MVRTDERTVANAASRPNVDLRLVATAAAAAASTLPDDPFAQGGEAGRILRGLDWARKPIGPVAGWPQSLRTALGICLASRHPICILWGRDRLYLYNDAYAPIVGAKHPWALGESYIAVWPEIWDTSIRPILEAVERTGEASWCDNLLLVLQRRGFNEECYFSFSFAPTRVEDGSVGGVFTAITETTPQVIGERRLRTLRDLGANSAGARTPDEACRAAAAVLAANAHDVPFALFYLTSDDGRTARLVERVGLDGDSPACAAEVSLAPNAPATWPLATASTQAEPVEVKLPAALGDLPGGPWPEPAHTAVVLPIARAGQGRPHGFIIAGVSPRRLLDDDYRGFLKLAASQVATAVSNAEAYAEERRRAEALAEIDRAKTAFFSNVSHEFRTPLTLMLGPLEELLAKNSGELSDRVRSQIELAHRNSLRLLKLVNTLLDFSRIEAGRIQASYEPLDLGTFTGELASLFRSAVEKAGLRLIVDCPPSAQPFHVDRDMWEKIVCNLLSNAFKFTLHGEIEVTVRESADGARLTVRDTGVGIPEPELPNVFTRFHRIENLRSRTHEGTGIGLALSQELARLHGGVIRVESAAGVGSTFTVCIPAGRAHLPEDRIRAPRALSPTAVSAGAFIEEALRWVPEATPAASRAADATPDSTAPLLSARTLGRSRILVADDNADMRRYVHGLLEDIYEVRTVADGLEALAAIEGFHPDLVLADVMMPRVDGFGLLGILRSRPATRTLPVILLSARAGAQSSVEGYDAGADDYLIKPFAARELLARVSSHLRMSRLRGEVVRADELAREARERLEATLIAADVGTWSWDVQSNRVIADRNLARWFGLSAEAAAGAPLDVYLRAIHPADRDEVSLRLAQAIQSGAAEYEAEYRLSPANGVTRWIVARGKIERDVRKRPDRCTGVVIDVTARHEAEAAVRRLAAIVECSDDAIISQDLDGTITSWNRGAERVYGYEAGEIVGQPGRRLISADRLHEEVEVLRRIQSGEPVEQFETVRMRKDGRLVHVSLTISPLKNGGGDVLGVSTIARDITARRRAEAQQHALYELLSRVNRAAALPDVCAAALDAICNCHDAERAAILLCDARGVMRFTAWRGLSEQYRALVEGHSPWEPGDTDPQPVWIDDVATASLDGVVRQAVEAEGIRALVFIPLTFEQRLLGKFMIYHDEPRRFSTAGLRPAQAIASQVAFAIERQRSAEALENLVNERTASLRKAIAQMEEFSYSVSHDLRAPLRAMRGYAAALMFDHATGLDDVGRDLVARIQRNGTRMDCLIRDILTYTQLSRPINFEPVAVGTVIREVIQQYPEMQTPRAAIEVAGPLPVVMGHEPLLTQVISNLLGNAVKFVPAGTVPRVRVWSERRDARVRVWFEDNGIGIKPQYQARLFGMFERVHPDKGYEGTGIGLAIVRKALERMNGAVGVESDGASGSRFWIEVEPALDAAPAV